MSVSFDRIAERYDATRGFGSGISEQVGQGIVREGRFGADTRVLEIGVGTGRIALPVLAAAPVGLRYTGVDISPAMMAQLRAKLPQGQLLALLQADAEHLPLPNARIDAILEMHVLHLVGSVENVVAEAQRVLRPGGLFISGYNHRASDSALHELSQGRLSAVLNELGFTPTRRRRPQREEAGEITQALRRAFGTPRVAVLAEWEERTTPREMLDALTQRTWSSTWDIPPDVLHEAVRRLEAQARDQFPDLNTPVVGATQFKVEIYTHT